MIDFTPTPEYRREVKARARELVRLAKLLEARGLDGPGHAIGACDELARIAGEVRDLADGFWQERARDDYARLGVDEAELERRRRDFHDRLDRYAEARKANWGRYPR